VGIFSGFLLKEKNNANTIVVVSCIQSICRLQMAHKRLERAVKEYEEIIVVY
jgi:protein-tyrosine-phosphatase